MIHIKDEEKVTKVCNNDYDSSAYQKTRCLSPKQKTDDLIHI